VEALRVTTFPLYGYDDFFHQGLHRNSKDERTVKNGVSETCFR
jgi:hypothetical protein